MSSKKKLSSGHVTQKDIATKCSLSLMTVSRILRGDQKMFKAETVDTVLKTAKALGYDPAHSIAARRLRYSREKNVSVENKLVAFYFSLQNAEDQYFNRLLRAISIELSKENYCLLTNWTPKEYNSPPTIPAIFDRGEVDGVLTLSGVEKIDVVIEKLRQSPGFMNNPIVTMMEKEPDGCYVLIDDVSGGYELMSHLLDLGHPEVLYTPYTIWQIQQRLVGCRKACEERGLDPDKVLLPFKHANCDKAFNKDSILKSFKKHPNCKAIFAGNDHTAVQIARLMREEGIEVGRDISLVGFDNTIPLPGPDSENTLTTIKVPLEEVAQHAVRLLIARIRNQVPTGEQITLPVELVVRNSTIPYKK